MRYHIHTPQVQGTWITWVHRISVQGGHRISGFFPRYRTSTLDEEPIFMLNANHKTAYILRILIQESGRGSGREDCYKRQNALRVQKGKERQRIQNEIRIQGYKTSTEKGKIYRQRKTRMQRRESLESGQRIWGHQT